MAILTFNQSSEKRIAELNISEWRVIRQSTLWVGHFRIGFDYIRSSLITLAHGTYNVALTTNQIISLDGFPKTYVKEGVIFSNAGGASSGYCGSCRGSGKIDWVSKAMVPPNHRLPSIGKTGEIARDSFTRDQSGFLLYKFDTISTQRVILSRTILERSESYCKECSGTGIILDGRMRMFSGMPKIRKSLMYVGRNFFDDPEYAKTV